MVVSVIIPTYNRCNFIGLTLESFVKQNLDKSKFEIIVADNNSTDDTAKVVKDFINAHPDFRIRYFLEKRQGVHYARNSTAKIAVGEFLYFTDDDMIADPSALTELLYLFTLDPKIASVTGRVLPKWEVDPPDWVLKLCNNALLSLNDPDDDLIISEDDCNVFSCHQMIKRKIFIESGGFNPENTKNEWLGDGETGLNIKIKSLGYKFAFNRKSVIHHIIPAQRLTQKYLNKRLYNQGNSDSYTYYRKFKPSSAGLILNNMKHTIRCCIEFLNYLINKLAGNIRWRIKLANCYYSIARIKYNLRLMTDSSWRNLVLKMNWIDE
jgi:glucosyl-dolichyl phosphate glucuronosyltransferase